MKRILFVVLVVFTLSIALQAQNDPMGQRSGYHPLTGMLRFVGASPSQPISIQGADRAASILSIYAPQFGVAPQDLTLSSDKTIGQRTIRRYQQTYQGIPVFGGELIVQATVKGDLISMNGEASPNLNLNVTPAILTSDAQQTAITSVAKNTGFDASTWSASQPQLWIYDSRLTEDQVRTVALVWKVEVTSLAGRPVHQVMLINAHTGSIELSYNKIDTHWTTSGTQSIERSLPTVEPRVGGVAKLLTYDANNGTNLPGTLLCNETNMPCTSGPNLDSDANAAHIWAKEVYDFYWDKHGRDSIDGNGITLRSVVHYDNNDCNAYWDSTYMLYADGCGVTIVLDDVAGHELTHGVTEYTSNLVYAYQSGAMNESLSDVWGEIYDFTNNTNEDIAANRWVIGEELEAGGFRNMANPPVHGDPDRMGSFRFYQGSADNGGVHTNSGVNNKAAYLMVDGDTFNGYTITGLGTDKVLAIYYETQINHLTTNSNYMALRDGLTQSCTTLIGTAGITAADCVEVDEATLATEMDKPAIPTGVNTTLCDNSQPVGNVYFTDGFESGGGNWTTTGTASTWNTQFSATTPFTPITGSFSMRGLDRSTASDASAQMVNAVTLPAGSAYLYFKHRFAIEQLWDGGVVEYSTNGTTWNRVDSATFFDDGLDYTGEIEANSGTVLANQFSFTGEIPTSSTRYDLTSLAGQNVRFRFRIVSDGSIGDDGWLIDDVQIYTCGAASTATNTPVPPTSTATTEAPTSTATTVPPTSTSTAEAATSTATTEAATATSTIEAATSTATTEAPTATATSESATATSTSEAATATSTTNAPTATVTAAVSTATATTEAPTATATTEAATATATTEAPTATNTPESSSVELLTNAGFELHTLSNKLPDDWNGKGLAKDKLKCNTDTKTFSRTGLCAFLFVGGVFENARLSQATEDVSALTGGITLNASVFYKSNAVTPRLKVKLVVFYTDTALRTVTKAVINTASSSDYSPFSLAPYSINAASTVTKVKFQLQNRALTGKIYLDDASVNYIP